MTSWNRPRIRNRDGQDAYKLGVHGKLEYKETGAIVTVRHNGGYLNEEVPYPNFGYSWNPPENFNTETHVSTDESDTDRMHAQIALPRDKQRKWPVGAGGVQHPTDPDRAVEFNGDETWLQDGVFKVGPNKEVTLTIKDGQVTINTAKLKIQADIELEGEILTHNGKDIGFEHRHTDVVPGGGLTGFPE